MDRASDSARNDDFLGSSHTSLSRATIECHGTANCKVERRETRNAKREALGAVPGRFDGVLTLTNGKLGWDFANREPRVRKKKREP